MRFSDLENKYNDRISGPRLPAELVLGRPIIIEKFSKTKAKLRGVDDAELFMLQFRFMNPRDQEDAVTYIKDHAEQYTNKFFSLDHLSGNFVFFTNSKTLIAQIESAKAEMEEKKITFCLETTILNQDGTYTCS